MASEHSPGLYTLGQPSTSYMVYMDGVNNRPRAQVNGDVPSGHAEYLYPAHVESDSEDVELPVGIAGGNWGKKTLKGSRWVRRGKAVAWGPSKVEWEVRASAVPALHCLHFNVMSLTPRFCRQKSAHANDSSRCSSLHDAHLHRQRCPTCARRALRWRHRTPGPPGCMVASRRSCLTRRWRIAIAHTC